MVKTKKRRGGEKAPRSNKPAREGSVLDYKSWCVSHPPNSRTLNKSKKAYSDMTPEEKEEFCPPIKGELASAPPSEPPSAPPSEPPSRSETPPPPPAAVSAGPPPPSKEDLRRQKLARLQGKFESYGGPNNKESSEFGGRSRRRRRSRKSKRKTRRHRK